MKNFKVTNIGIKFAGLLSALVAVTFSSQIIYKAAAESSKQHVSGDNNTVISGNNNEVNSQPNNRIDKIDISSYPWFDITENHHIDCRGNATQINCTNNGGFDKQTNNFPTKPSE